jgi:hypothetical protein
VLVIAFCDHELSDRIYNRFRAIKWEVRRRRMRRPARCKRALPKAMREPASIKQNEFAEGPELFGVAGLTQKQTKE